MPPGLDSGSQMDDEIPPEIFDQIAAQAAAAAAAENGGGAGASGSSGDGGIRICPHCTFENTHGGHDCEVCGLPL